MAQTLTSEGIVLAAVMMRRGGNRARLLVLIGGAPHDQQHFHSLSTRTAGHCLGVSIRHVHALLEQLVGAGVLERRPGAGSRPDAWRVRGDVRRWAVLWPLRRDPDHVRLILADAGHLIDVSDVAPPPVARASMGVRGAGFARAFMGEREPALSRTNGSAREGSGLRALIEARESLSSSSSESAAVGTDKDSERRRRSEEVEAFVWALRGIVYRATGRPTIGKGIDRLAALHGRLELDRAEQALTMLPDNAGWPLVLEALELEASVGPLARVNGRRVAVRYSFANHEGRWAVRAEEFPTDEAAAARVAELRAGAGWPDDAAELEVDEPSH
jgi:hypothetical protein